MGVHGEVHICAEFSIITWDSHKLLLVQFVDKLLIVDVVVYLFSLKA